MAILISYLTVALALNAMAINAKMPSTSYLNDTGSKHQLLALRHPKAIITKEVLRWHTTPSEATHERSAERPDTNDILEIPKTLTSTVSKFVSDLGLLNDTMSGIKLVASFFRTTYTTETNKHYWEELSETAVAMVNEAIDDTIIGQTNVAVDRVSENLQIYIDSNSTEGKFSALELCLLMDEELNEIKSLYAGINHAERIAMHYLDMATTRLSLWQATALIYIDEYNIEGTLPSNDSVCDIVDKWDLAFSTETAEIATMLKPALDTWNNNYRDQLSMSCSVSKHDPAFHEWKKYIDCKIFDGYHGVDAETWSEECHKKSNPKCPGDDFVCFNYCLYSRLYPHINSINDGNYNTLINLVNTMTSNFLVIQKTQLDYYKEQCDLGYNVTTAQSTSVTKAQSTSVTKAQSTSVTQAQSTSVTQAQSTSVTKAQSSSVTTSYTEADSTTGNNAFSLQASLLLILLGGRIGIIL